MSDPPPPRVSHESWEAPSALECTSRPSRWAHVLLSLLFVALATGAAWALSGRHFRAKGLQAVADRWAALERCLLGPRVRAGVRPSERWRQIALSYEVGPDEPWPQRCMSHAAQLDAALRVPEVIDALGVKPTAAALLSRPMDAVLARQLDALWDALAKSDVPGPRRVGAVTPAPKAVRPLLRAKRLVEIGRARDLASVAIALDPARGEVARLMFLGRKPRLCRLVGKAPNRWSVAECRALEVRSRGAVELRLARTEPGGADVVYRLDARGRDGYYDGSSGTRLWRPRFPGAQAVVQSDGTTTVLYADLRREEGISRIDAWRIAQLVVGRAPRTRRVQIPNGARTLLLPREVLWWNSSEDGSEMRLQAARLSQRGRTLRGTSEIGALPPGSEHADDCATPKMSAVLFRVRRGPALHTLLFRTSAGFSAPVAIERITEPLWMSCHGDVVVLGQSSVSGTTAMRCTPKSCSRAEGAIKPPSSDLIAATSVGETLMMVWRDAGGVLRLRSAPLSELSSASQRIVFDDPDHGGLDLKAMRLVSSGGLGLLLLQTVDDRVFALRIDEHAQLRPVQVLN